jgi:hypothetical protein
MLCGGSAPRSLPSRRQIFQVHSPRQLTRMPHSPASPVHWELTEGVSKKEWLCESIRVGMA